jgi:phage terminase small subunit
MTPQPAKKPRPLSPRQRRFIAEYLVDLNGKQAYIRAGYSPNHAEVGASQLLRFHKVARAVAAGKAKQLQTAELTAASVLEAIRRQVHGDVRRLFDKRGRFRPIHKLSAEDAALIGGFDVTQADVTPGERGPAAEVLKVKLAPRERYVEMAAKHFALLTEVVRVEEQASLEQRLLAGRQRVAEARKAREKA